MIVVLAFSAIIVSCDTIPLRDRIEGQPLATGDSVDMDTVPATRNVLLEDFTGIKCGFCPPAAVEATRLRGLPFGSRLFVVGVHAGGFAVPDPAGSSYFTVDLRTPVGEQLFGDFAIPGTPRGLINRMQSTVNSVLVRHYRWSNWEGVITQFMNLPQMLKLHAAATVNSGTRGLSVNINALALQTLPDNQFINVYIVEDEIETYQKWYSHTPEVVPNYRQKQVLRTSLTGTYGQLLGGTGALAVGRQVAQRVSGQAGADWNLANLKAIVFVANNQGFDIQQVIETPVRIIN